MGGLLQDRYRAFDHVQTARITGVGF